MVAGFSHLMIPMPANASGVDGHQVVAKLARAQLTGFYPERQVGLVYMAHVHSNLRNPLTLVGARLTK